MEYFPLFYRVKTRVCLVVGGGEVAFRKSQLLLRAGAQLVIVSPQFSAEFTAWQTPIANQGASRLLGANVQKSVPPILFLTQSYSSDLIQGTYFGRSVELVIGATDSPSVNAEVAEAAERLGKLVNIVDCPELSSVILPAIIDRAPVLVAVSSEGQSPVLARYIRAKLETYIPAGFGELARFMGGQRQKVKALLNTVSHRRIFWEEVIASPIAEYLFHGKKIEAHRLFEQKLSQWAEKSRGDLQGEVYLVGAGPGDPDLLTFRALRLMQQADVVLYDRLVSEPILDLVRRDATKIYVGKSRKHHAVPQEDINQLLVKLAKEGKRVCRLKGGDPFIFGRGGEEIDLLADEGIPFQVVPGITAASGCACYAGIPLTHRDYSQSVMFVTAHTKDGNIDINWSVCAQKGQTVVYYMGLNNLQEITTRLMAHGMDSETPIALIERGTTPYHRVLTGRISDFYQTIQPIYDQVHAPTLIIVGDVVKLHAKLAWYQPDALSAQSP